MLPESNRRDRRAAPVAALGTLAAVVTFIAASAAPGVARAASWSLLGAVNDVKLIEPLDAGKILLCTPVRCDVWDVHHAASAPTERLPVVPIDLGHARLRDGRVLVVDQRHVSPAQIWSPTTGRWTAATPPPAECARGLLGTLTDGRVLCIDATNFRLPKPRAFIADDHLRAWAKVADFPVDVHPGPGVWPWSCQPTAFGAIAFTFEPDATRFWRYVAAQDRWEEAPVRNWPKSAGLRPLLWGDDLLFLAPRGDKSEGWLVGIDGQTRLQPLPWSSSAAIEMVSTPNGSGIVLAFDKGRAFAWRQPAKPIEELPSMIGWYHDAAISETEIIWSGRAGALALLTLGDAPPAADPCAGLERYLSRAIERAPAHGAPWVLDGKETFASDLVSDGCRAQVRSGHAPALTALVRGWTRRSEPAWRQLGRILSCTIEDPDALPRIQQWIAVPRDRVDGLACASALLDWPGAEGTLRPWLAHSIGPTTFGWWQIDPMLQAVIDTYDPFHSALTPANDKPAARAELVPVLRAAEKHHAWGFDPVHRAVCLEDGAQSPERMSVCADTRGEAESAWTQEREQMKEKTEARENDTTGSHAVTALVATGIVAGAIAGAYAGRRLDAGLEIATAAGVLGGAAIGFSVAGIAFYTAGVGLSSPGGGSDSLGPILLGSCILGGVLGGFAAHAAAASPSARAPVTAVGLALPYVYTLVFTFH